MSKLAKEDIPEAIERIYKTMMAFMYWKQSYKTSIANSVANNNLDEARIQKLKNNYNTVMKALTVALTFIEENKEFFNDCKDALVFGVIHAGMQNVETDDEDLLKAIELYKEWYKF
jgi:hypothetical protein